MVHQDLPLSLPLFITVVNLQEVADLNPDPNRNPNHLCNYLDRFDFVVDRLFMKLFKTANILIVRECQKILVLSYPVLSSIRDAVNLLVSTTLV